MGINNNDDAAKESVNDLMDSLMKAKDIEGKHLKDEEILDNIVNSILLGHISSAYAVTWCHYFLAKSPTVLQKLRVIDYFPNTYILFKTIKPLLHLE